MSFSTISFLLRPVKLELKHGESYRLPSQQLPIHFNPLGSEMDSVGHITFGQYTIRSNLDHTCTYLFVTLYPVEMNEMNFNKGSLPQPIA
jgi:hypothetical protein